MCTLPTLHPRPVLTRPVHARLAGLSVERSATMPTNVGGDRGHGAVKSKQPAPMQVTAEQILREAHERQYCPCHMLPENPKCGVDDFVCSVCPWKEADIGS